MTTGHRHDDLDLPADVGCRRAVIENVRLNFDDGRFPIKWIAGDRVHVQAWTDRFNTSYRDLRKPLDAGQDVTVDLRIGADLVSALVQCAMAANNRPDWLRIPLGGIPELLGA